MATETQSLPAGNENTTLRKIGIGSVIVGIIVGGWIWQQRPRPRSLPAGPPRPSTTGSGMQAQMMGGMIPPSAGLPPTTMGMSGRVPYIPSPLALSGRFRPGIGMQRVPQPISRYFANLADKTGPYVVSVRQVILDAERQADLYNNLPGGTYRPTLSQVSISLQVMSANTGEITKISDFATRLRLVDNLGNTYECANVGILQPFEKGLARMIGTPRLDSHARYLKSIEGQITLNTPASGSNASEGDKQQRRVLSFRIPNVPLPVENHLFGVACGAFLPEDLSVSPAESMPLSPLNASQLKQVNRLFPPYAPEPNPLGVPNRLLLQSNLPNTFLIPLPGGEPPVRCTLKPVIGTDGEIQALCKIEAEGMRSKPVSATLKLWDDVPLAVVCSERALNPDAPRDRKLALWFHLYTDLPNEWQPAISPFPATQKERGGSLAGKVFIGKEPLRRGTVRLEITRTDNEAAARKGAVQVEAMLNDEGRWCVANCSPGVYRVRALIATPYRSRVVKRSEPEKFLCRRYRLADPTLTNAQQENLQVRGGGELVLKTFVVTEGDA